MTVGRWFLIHSFSIFLVAMFLLGYVFREELQLEQAYRQLLNLEQQTTADNGAQKTEAAARTQTERSLIESNEPTADTPPKSVSAATDSEQASGRIESMDGQMAPGLPTVSTSVIQLDDLLYQARKAYWDGDYQLAIRLYQQLIEDDGDNADHIGELGNIYYAINDFDNAARQFYQAAIILIARGKREQARLLLSPITAMDRDLGDDLRQRLQR